jgi:large subunit ribosomal protein L23
MGVNPKSFIGLIKYPILTEKTVELLQKNQYSFAVDPRSDKPSIKAAVEQLFNVKVVSVNTASQPLRKRRVGKFIGNRSCYKRAIVTLVAEDSITFFEDV